jgi:hypothetical protein
MNTWRRWLEPGIAIPSTRDTTGTCLRFRWNLLNFNEQNSPNGNSGLRAPSGWYLISRKGSPHEGDSCFYRLCDRSQYARSRRRKSSMRALVVLACFVLAACSSVYNLPPVIAPDPEAATKAAKKASNEEKLVGSVEVSAVRDAHLVSPGPYIVCIRGAISATAPLRTYAVFFKTTMMSGLECRSSSTVVKSRPSLP